MRVTGARAAHSGLGGEPRQQRAKTLPAEGIVSRSVARRNPSTDNSLTSLPKANGPRKNSTEGCHSPRSFGIVCASETSVLPRAPSSIARLARTRIERKSRARPRAHCAGRSASSGPAASDRFQARSQRQLATGLRSGARSQCAPQIVRDAEGRGIGDAAAADPVGRLEQ